MADMPVNTFTNGRLGKVYLTTALPIIFVMSMNGLLTVADAMFLGYYVGAEALAAVTLIFPIYMLLVSLATLVASGMSSILARHLGAGDMNGAKDVYAGAHGLALALAAFLIVLFVLFGGPLVRLMAAGSEEIAQMGLVYLLITILFAPLVFVLAVNSDALRNEGHVGFMAAMSLCVSLTNIGFNYLLIGVFDMGVAGSAYGTSAAQLLTIAIIVVFRLRGNTELRPHVLLTHSLRASWGRILALGAPQSLNFMGFAIGSAIIIAALQWVDSQTYDATISAYGIVTRVITFAFLPLLGLSHAMQTITGNNYGARLWGRTNASLALSLIVAALYCALVQAVVMVFSEQIAGIFVDDLLVISEVARIFPIMTYLFVLVGPLMMIATHFQAIGSARYAAVLGLTKPYLFAIPLTVLLPLWIGETGIWLAGPIAEILLLILTVIVLQQVARRKNLSWGLFAAR